LLDKLSVEAEIMADEDPRETYDGEGEVPRARKVDLATKLQLLHDSLAKKKLRFYTLSEEIFDVNQEYLSKSDDLRGLREKYQRNHEAYINSMTEMALTQAELRYRKEHVQDTSHVVSNLAFESNTDVERYRSELKYALTKYQEARRTAKRLQNDFSKLSDGSRIQSLNFLAFCRYSQSTQMNEINKLSVSEELPSKKELTTCKKEFDKCVNKSRRDLASFYKAKIHEFQREERDVVNRCILAMKMNLARMNADGQDAAAFSSNVDHHLQVNSFENRVAQKLVMEANALLRTGSEEREGSEDEAGGGKGRLTASRGARVASQFSHVLLEDGRPENGTGASAKLTSGQPLSRGSKRNPSTPAAKRPHAPASPLPSYAQPTRAQTPVATSSAAGEKGHKPRTSSSASKAVPTQYRAQLAELYQSKKKAASAVQELHSARTRSVFDSRLFRAAPNPDSPLVHNCLLDSELTDTKTNANLVHSEVTGTYVDQGQALGDLMTQLCAAEGKFRQLNAIKEGLDLQLVKQAHFLTLVARDLQADIGSLHTVSPVFEMPLTITLFTAESKGKASGAHLSYPTPTPTGATKVLSTDLTRAFAPPSSSAGRSVGRLTAGGAISNKYRFRIDPSAATAPPFVPLSQV
jgi:hypothetical protein